jgi:hypothetical protein
MSNPHDKPDSLYDAWIDGQTAAFEGQPHWSNPFNPQEESKHWGEWNRGWQAEKDRSEDNE